MMFHFLLLKLLKFLVNLLLSDRLSAYRCFLSFILFLLSDWAQLCIRLGLRIFLLLHEFGIESLWVVSKELIMVALLNNLALLHHNNVVGMPNGGESVGYNNSGD
jgi:hypothetical protein